MFSMSVHDYKLCGCSNYTMIDGGFDYLRYGGKKTPVVIEWNKKLDGPLPPPMKDTNRWPY